MKNSFQYFSTNKDALNFKSALCTSDVKKKLIEQIENPKTQYAKAPFRAELLESCIQLKNKFLNINHFVHIGIGGSSLGPEMLIKALKNNSLKFHFINNIDPDDMQEHLDNISFDSALFYFVSKSGGTAETLAALALIINYYEMRGKNLEQIFSKFVFATDPVKSELLELAKIKNIPTLEIPTNVGGRFSALTPVGFFPALFAGINVRELLDGAILANELVNDVNSDLYKAAHYLITLREKENRSITVMMPYSSKLREFSAWFTQLWAESLGKCLDKSGHTIKTGFTPIPAYGATDQHSQMQLFMEGPEDKVLLMIEVENFARDFSLKNSFQTSSFNRLNGHRLSELIKAEFLGTLDALKEINRPFIHISIEALDAKNLGFLILYFELLTGLVGNHLNVDPFDQPGVELGKVKSNQWLNKLK